MKRTVVITLLLALVVLVALAQFAGANASPAAQATASPAAQTTTSPTAQTTAEGTGTPDETETPLPPPNRGCLACHMQIDPDGRFTLAWEAMTRMEDQGKDHPDLPFDTPYETCLACHDGNTAKPMSSIVHPAHMFSPIFDEEFRGNCFSCHEIQDGEYTVLVDRQNVNDKGVIQPTTTGTPATGTPAANGTPGAQASPSVTSTP